jgi:uncharacterized membrane protein
MASSKARSRNRPAPGKGGRSAAGTGSGGTGSGGKGPGAKSPGAARTVPTAPAASAVSAVSTAPAARTRAKQAPPPEEPVLAPPSGPPLWLQLTSLVLAVIGLAISAYETYAHYNGSHLLGCSAKAGGTFDCTAVITSPTSMVFGVIPVALLGLLFYVFAVPIMTPWAWRSRSREIGLARLGSLIVGMAFVLYLIYAELYDIKQVCEYCTGVHIVTFLLFCITVFSAAIWGVGERGHFPAFPGRSRRARR